MKKNIEKKLFICFLCSLLLIFITGIIGAQNVEDLRGQARKAFYGGNYNEAEILWKQVAEKGVYEWESNFFLGMIYLYLNQLEEADNYMEKAYNHQPQNYYTLVNHARILYRKEELKSAREKLLEVPEDMRDYNEQYYNVSGLVAMAEREFAQAIEYFNYAVEIEPDNYFVRNNLGLASIRKGDYEQARIHLEHAVDQDPSRPYVYNNLGITYENLNKLDLAKQNYEKALAMNPEYERAKINLQRVISQLDNE